MTFSNSNSLNNKVLYCGLILILVLLLFSCKDQSPTVYTIIFDPNGGTLNGKQSVIIVEGMPVPEPEAPTKSGYIFDGWYSDADTSIPYDFDTPATSSFTLYAKWTAKSWTVTFQPDGGTEIDSQSVANCNKAVKPDNPEKEGYTFEGWYSDTDTSIPYDFNSPVIADITLYAKWTQITYTVTFDANLPGGVVDEALSGMPESIISIPFGESVGEKTAPTLNGYVFKGWYRTKNPEENDKSFNLASDSVMENLTLYAKWSNEATVTFNSNGGSFSGETEMTVTYGSTLTELPADPNLKKNGNTYIFIGWYANGEPFDLSEPITSDTTVEAKWSDSYSNNAGYFVYDAEGLIAWAEAAQRDMDLNCTLEKDIILPDVSAGERNWTAADPTLGYTGTFDGNSKTIMNLAGNQGIFGHIGEGGTVKSLTLENVSISSSSRVGAIAGSNQGTIEDCSVSGNIKGGEYVGGICGYNNVGKITDCHFSGSVEGTKSVGGVCGQSFYNSTITACYSTGSVSGSESVGGVCGATLEGTLIACYSTSYVKGTYKVGGVCGYLDEGTLTACYSTGSVEGKSWVGAVCGDHGGYYSSSTINACYWSVPSTTSSLVGIGSGYSLSAKTVEVTGGSVTWTEGDNSALSAMNAAISQNYKYAENTNPGTNAEMPLVLVPKK